MSAGSFGLLKCAIYRAIAPLCYVTASLGCDVKDLTYHEPTPPRPPHPALAVLEVWSTMQVGICKRQRVPLQLRKNRKYGAELKIRRGCECTECLTKGHG